LAVIGVSTTTTGVADALACGGDGEGLGTFVNVLDGVAVGVTWGWLML
jgi:hypothetical protein